MVTFDFKKQQVNITMSGFKGSPVYELEALKRALYGLIISLQNDVRDVVPDIIVIAEFLNELEYDSYDIEPGLKEQFYKAKAS